MSVSEAKPERKNRTITLYLGSTLAEYEATYLTTEGIQAVIERVEVADSINCLNSLLDAVWPNNPNPCVDCTLVTLSVPPPDLQLNVCSRLLTT